MEPPGGNGLTAHRIGKRTALRLVLFLLNQPNSLTIHLSKSLIDLVDGVVLCKNCHNISDLEICEICSNIKRDKSIICVVEDIRDVMAIESTGQFSGVYHVLGGKISPIEGIGPNQLNISSLTDKIKSENISELIFALSATNANWASSVCCRVKIRRLSMRRCPVCPTMLFGPSVVRCRNLISMFRCSSVKMMGR